MRRLGGVVAALVWCVGLAACGGGTDPASNVGALTATLNGHGHTDSTPGHYEFQYAVDPQALGTGFGEQTPTRGPIPPNVPGNGKDQSFRENAGGLTLGTTYYYRACGGDGQVKPDACASTQSFTTASSPSFTYFPLSSKSAPGAIVPGPDGALWFIDGGAGSIGRITTTGSVTEYPLPTGDQAESLAGAFDGALWFTDPANNAIGRMTTNGTVSEHSLPTASAAPRAIVSGPDAALWFTEYNANKIGRISLDGRITEYPLPTPHSTPTAITPGPDGALWFTELRGYIGQITTNGTITEYQATDLFNPPGDIAAGSDKALWFLQPSKNQIGRITTKGSVTFYPLSISNANSLIAGPDGALWYLSATCGSICVSYLGRTTTNGRSTSFYLDATLGSVYAAGLGSGSDGALWLTSDAGGYGTSTPRVIRAG